MAVTIHKLVNEGETVTLQPVVQNVSVEVVDEYAASYLDLQKKLAKLKPLIEKVEKMEKTILAAVDEAIDASKPVNLQGEKYVLEISKKGAKTEISDMLSAYMKLEGVKKGLGLELMKFNIGDLKKYLAEKEVEKLCEVKNVNKRRVAVKKLA